MGDFMLKVYGSLQCKDCVACKEAFEQKGIPFEYHDIADDLAALKEFLKIRDIHPLFDRVRQEGKIGIPCLVLEDGTVTLNWEQIADM